MRQAQPLNTFCNARPLALHSLLSSTVARMTILTSNGNDIEAKANVSFDNGVVFDSEAKRTRSILNFTLVTKHYIKKVKIILNIRKKYMLREK